MQVGPRRGKSDEWRVAGRGRGQGQCGIFQVIRKLCGFETPPFFFAFLGLHLRHMEVPRLGIQLELQLLVTTTATAMQDP